MLLDFERSRGAESTARASIREALPAIKREILPARSRSIERRLTQRRNRCITRARG